MAGSRAWIQTSECDQASPQRRGQMRSWGRCRDRGQSLSFGSEGLARPAGLLVPPPCTWLLGAGGFPGPRLTLPWLCLHGTGIRAAFPGIGSLDPVNTTAVALILEWILDGGRACLVPEATGTLHCVAHSRGPPRRLRVRVRTGGPHERGTWGTGEPRARTHHLPSLWATS